MDRGVDCITLCSRENWEHSRFSGGELNSVISIRGVFCTIKKISEIRILAMEKSPKCIFMCKLKPSWYESILLKMRKRQTFMVRTDQRLLEDMRRCFRSFLLENRPFGREEMFTFYFCIVATCTTNVSSI